MRPTRTAMAALLSLCGLAASASAETLRYAFQGDAQTMDPHGLNETFTLGFQRNIYEPLVIQNEKLELTGALATSWEAVEPTVWRFKLRQGVKFHGGEDFTAEDVAFSLDRMRTEGSDMKWLAAMVSETRIIDDYTIDFVTPNPNPILLLEFENFYIMDKGWSEANDATEATNVAGGDEGNYANLNANGTGPFMLKERQPGVKTVLAKNPNWWGSAPTNVTDVVFTPIEQDATRVAALMSGDVDMIFPVPVQDWERLNAAEGVAALTGPEIRTIFLGMDQARDELLHSNVKGKNPFKDLRVRQAFMKAIDINAIRDKIMRGASQPTALMVAPAVRGFNKELNDARMKLDIEGARALMADAGYPDGFEVTMDCPNNRYMNDEKICQAVAAMLSQIGVKIDLLAQPKSKYFAKVLAQNDYDTSFFMLGWSPTSFDSHDPIASLFSCRVDGLGEYNLGGYCNERVTELGKMIQQEVDDTKRQAMIDEAFKIHIDEVGHIPLHQQPLSWGVSDRIGVFQRPDNVFDIRYAVIK